MHEIMMEKDGVRQAFLDDVDAFFAKKPAFDFQDRRDTISS